MSNSKELGLVILSVFTTIIYTLGIVSSFALMDIQLVLLVIFIIVDFLKKHRVTMIQIWIIGFIYIIWSDMVLCCHMALDYNDSYTFLYISNAAVIIAYVLHFPKRIKQNDNIKFQLKSRRLYLLITIIVSLYFVITSLPLAIANVVYGRQMSATLGSGNVGGMISSACGLLAPSLIAYYYFYIKRRSKWMHLLFCVPLFVIQYFLSTRYKIVYQFIPYLIIAKVIDLNYQSIKKLSIVAILAVIMNIGSSFLKENRNTGYSWSTMNEYAMSSSHTGRWDVNAAEKMSPEGVVKMTDLSHTYFEHENHTYGKEITFMFYFWIPRSIWTSKPYPIDYWLIRKYEIVSDTFSTASGFTGEIYADFGWFCIFVLFIFGIILKKSDKFVSENYSDIGGNINMLLCAMIYPCVFFFIRSPLTSMECFFVEVVVFLLIRSVCFKKVFE